MTMVSPTDGTTVGFPCNGVPAAMTTALDEDEAIHKHFNYSKFSNLAKRVLKEGDVEALKTLERFRARWREKYGFGSVGSVSSSVGSIMEVATSPMRTEGCGVQLSTPPPRVSSHRVLPRVSSAGDKDEWSCELGDRPDGTVHRHC
ncbi:hypothetical protein Salat_2645300 [Sesamum alatum]|uniref:Uncharacterized protein n=1 Tax=Sesamum alatum TaxID=300844 RepID=A0AAE1XPT3_9LAMI|nr:hypothetical protein Salat_2645300 [Sesamum alatum]